MQPKQYDGRSGMWIVVEQDALLLVHTYKFFYMYK